MVDKTRFALSESVVLLRLLGGMLTSLLLVAGTSACSSDTVAWKEQVTLHDGSTLMVERSHIYGRYGELGQGRLIAERTLMFQIPGSTELVTWRTEGALDPLAIEIVKGVPYAAALPGTCATFFQWGEPNPPYVFFRYDRRQKKWQRIRLDEFPKGTNTNLVVDTKNREDAILREMRKRGFVSAGARAKINRDLEDYIKNIIRMPITSGSGTYGGCR